jgi:hypothetical protein
MIYVSFVNGFKQKFTINFRNKNKINIWFSAKY